jgi:hypothetical protein
MFGFLKKKRPNEVVRLPSKHMVRTWKNKCLIQTYKPSYALWVDETCVTQDGDFIAVTINPGSFYMTSCLETMLNDDDYVLKSDCLGSEILSMFNPQQQ